MGKSFFNNLILSRGKKSLKLNKKSWSWIFLIFVFCAGLFTVLQTSTKGEDETPHTYNVVFYNNDSDGSDGSVLVQMADIYVYKGNNAPISPFDSAQGNGIAVGVELMQANGTNPLSTTATEGVSVTIYVNPKPMYSDSHYQAAIGETILIASDSILSNPRSGAFIQGSSNSSIIISGLQKNTHTVTFASGSSNPSGVALADMLDVYIFTGTGSVPDSPPAGSAGDTQKLEKIEGSDDLSTVVQEGNSLIFYTKPTSAYDQSQPNYKVSWDDSVRASSVVDNGYQQYNLASVTSDKTVTISDLKKNIYTITFESGDSNNLSDYVNLYDSDGETSLSWLDITTLHGDNRTFILKPKTGYKLDAATVKVNEISFDLSGQQSENQLTLDIENITINTTITVSDVTRKQYNIYFKDENNNTVATDKAEIIDRSTQKSINENYQLTWTYSVRFRIDLNASYNRSTVTVEVNGQTCGKFADDNNYYEFTLADPQDTTIVIKGIVLNKYSSEFSLSNAAFNNKVKAFYNEYDESNQQTGSTQEIYPNTTPVKKDSLIPDGSAFKFYLQVTDTSENIFNYSGTTNQNIDYEPSNAEDPLNAIIDAASVTGAGGITYNVNTSKTQVCIIFKKITGDISVQVKDLSKVSYTMNFNVPSGTDNHIKIYKGQLEVLHNEGYFYRGDQVFGTSGSDFIRSTSAVNSESFYFTVSLFDGALSPDSAGIKCTATEGTVSQPSYTVYTQKEGSTELVAVKIFEVKGVTSQSINVSIEGVHFSQYDVNFKIGNQETSTASVMNYANESIISNNSLLKIPYNGSLKIRIEPDEGYYLDEIDKQVNVLDSNDQNVNFEYKSYSDHADVTIINIHQNLNVSINLDTEKIPITFNPIEGFQYYEATSNNDGTDVSVKEDSVIRGIITVPYGSDYCFAVKAETGYDINSAVLKINGSVIQKIATIDSTYIIFKILSIRSSSSITGSISKTKHTITFNTTSVVNSADSSGSSYNSTVTYFQNGVALYDNIISIQHGGSTSFQVRLEEQCNQSDLKVVCYPEKSDSREISAVNGTYYITDITQNMEIKVENLTYNRYVINFVATSSASYLVGDSFEDKIASGTRTVTYGTNYSFGVQANPGYVIGQSMVVNCKTASGVSRSLTPDSTSGKYTIANIKENSTITIENVDNIIYNVNLVAIDGVTYYNDVGAVISGNIKIKYGQNFEFGVGIDDAYDDSIAGMYIVVNDGRSSNLVAQKLSSGRYIIPNVTEDINIKVGNIKKNRYTVTLTKIEGIDYYNTSGKVITGDNEVEHKGSLSFKVRLYPAYSDSKITVMLGDNAMTCDNSGVYTIPGIDENKTITVLGVEMTKEVELINKINNLPKSVKSLSDVSAVIEATKIYNNLSSDEKESITNMEVLQNLQEQVKTIHHTANSITAKGVDWYVKLVVVPLSSDADACSKIYKKLGSEYILSLYDIYLWDTLSDKRYNPPEDQAVTISAPMPDMTYFENPTIIHEKSDGKLDYISLKFKGNNAVFETSSFSPMGVIAKRSSTPGRSSLLDAVDANVNAIKNFALTSYNSSSSHVSPSTDNTVYNDTGTNTSTNTEDLIQGNINEKFKSKNNEITVEGSALRLTLVLMCIILVTLCVWVVVKNRRQSKSKNKS